MRAMRYRRNGYVIMLNRVEHLSRVKEMEVARLISHRCNYMSEEVLRRLTTLLCQFRRLTIFIQNPSYTEAEAGRIVMSTLCAAARPLLLPPT